jgi:hypothetical protein
MFFAQTVFFLTCLNIEIPGVFVAITIVITREFLVYLLLLPLLSHGNSWCICCYCHCYHTGIPGVFVAIAIVITREFLVYLLLLPLLSHGKVFILSEI